MFTIKDFLGENKELLTGVDSRKIATTAEIVNQLVPNIGGSMATNLVKTMTTVAISDGVIEELSKEVGEPKSGETEKEFVDRALSELKAIMKKKINS